MEPFIEKVPSCVRVPGYKQSRLFMQKVVARKSGVNQKRKKRFKKVQSTDLCGVHEHSLFSGLVQNPNNSMKQNKTKKEELPPCHAILKKCTLKIMTFKKMSHSEGQKSSQNKPLKKAFVYIFMQVRRQPIIPKFTRMKIN